MGSSNLPEFNKKKLAKYIQDQLEKLDVSHKELARLADIPGASTIGSILQQHYADTPSLKTLAAIAINLGNMKVGDFISYLYDESNEYYSNPITASLIESSVRDMEIEELTRILKAVSLRLEQIQLQQKQSKYRSTRRSRDRYR